MKWEKRARGFRGLILLAGLGDERRSVAGNLAQCEGMPRTYTDKGSVVAMNKSSRVLVTMLFMSVMAGVQGCDRAPGRAANPSLATVAGLGGRLNDLRSGMTEKEAIACLGLSAYTDYLVFHSTRAGSLGVEERRIVFPSAQGYTLSMTARNGQITYVVFESPSCRIQWESK